ncbi:MAG: type II toxin-antitoxin system prevent-host-death family antitoxin [Patescibacteria group bacterium]
MLTTRVSSTKLKRETARILNEVAFGNVEVVVERHGEPVARVVPVVTTKRRTREEWEKILRKSFGSMPDFPEVHKLRHFSKTRTIDL